MTGDFGRCTGRIGDRGGMFSSSSSMSGVRERPSESLKLFSLGIVVRVFVVGDGAGWTEKIEPSCSVNPLTTVVTIEAGRSSKAQSVLRSGTAQDG